MTPSRQNDQAHSLSHRIPPKDCPSRCSRLHQLSTPHSHTSMSDPISSCSPLLTHGCPPDLCSILPKFPQLEIDELYRRQIFHDARSIRKPAPTENTEAAKRIPCPQRQLSDTFRMLKVKSILPTRSADNVPHTTTTDHPISVHPRSLHLIDSGWHKSSDCVLVQHQHMERYQQSHLRRNRPDQAFVVTPQPEQAGKPTDFRRNRTRQLMVVETQRVQSREKTNFCRDRSGNNTLQ